VYWDAGKATVAFQWWKRAADMQDGDATVDVGYCCQHGIGTRKDTGNAKRMLRRAIACKNITQYGREEAMYHLAVEYLDEGKTHLACELLKRANAAADYPEAASLLHQINTTNASMPCRCRRLVNKSLRGHAVCMLHPR
jgi:TPR repeat protein